MNDSDWQLSTTIKSIPEKGCELVCTIREKLTELAWPENDVFKIHLALEEIIMNAIKHGNQLNPDKNVTVNCDVAAGVFKADILDEGEGFDRDDVPDPTQTENLLQETGRGLTIIENFMTSVEYVGSGNRVKISKKKSA